MRFNIHISESQYSRLIMSEDVEGEYSSYFPRVQPIGNSAGATESAFKNTMDASDINILNVGEPGTLELPGAGGDMRVKSERQQRILQWYSNVIASPDSPSTRGKTFEGLIAAAFGGSVSNNEKTLNKIDVDIPSVGEADGYGISIKFSEKKPESKQLLGGVVTGVNAQLQNDEEIKELLNEETITSVNIIKTFDTLIKSEIGKDFIKKALTRPDTFEPIDYFMFGTEGRNKEVLIYQYKREDIINHIAQGYYFFNKVGAIGVSFLTNLTPIEAKISFPKYAKSVRYKYRSNRDNVVVNFTNEKTLALNVTKALTNEFFLVGQVFRQYSNGEIQYHFDQVLNRDGLNRPITIENNVKLESIAKAINLDIDGLDYNTNSTKFKDFVKKLKEYSETISKQLFNSKVKVSEKGREGGLQKMFGTRGHTINPIIIQRIKQKPSRFISNLFKVYGCDESGLEQIQMALNNVFNINIQLPLAQYCVAGNNPQPEAVQESVNKVLKTLNEAIEKKK